MDLTSIPALILKCKICKYIKVDTYTCIMNEDDI